MEWNFCVAHRPASNWTAGVIVVIADDISGAAELAGAAFERGFSAEAQTRFDPGSGAEVIALDTHTRQLPPAEAARRVGSIAAEVAASTPALIYKKTDSVLRGSIVPEIDAILGATGRTRSLLIPANPSRGRIIQGGEYFVNRAPLTETEFANDPTHPAWTSNVLELLGPSSRGGTSSVRAEDGIFEQGVTVPDTTSPNDLTRRAAELDETVLPAGGAEFFGAILDRARQSGTRSPNLAVEGEASPASIPEDRCAMNGSPALLVCGSVAAWTAGREAQALRQGFRVFPMPKSLFVPETPEAKREAIAEWASKVRDGLENQGRAMIAIGRAKTGKAKPQELLDRLVAAVALTLENTPANSLLLEGGATARAVIDRIGWTRFETVGAVEGLSWLRPTDEDRPALLIKPGSYDWPEKVAGEDSAGGANRPQ